MGDIFGPVRGALFEATASLMEQCREQVVQAHRAAAEGLARMLMASLGEVDGQIAGTATQLSRSGIPG